VVCRDLILVEPLNRSSKLVAVGRYFQIGASHSLLSCLSITRVLRLELILIHLRAPYAIGMLLVLMPAAVVWNGPKKHKPIRMTPEGKGPLSFTRNDVWFLDANNYVIPNTRGRDCAPPSYLCSPPLVFPKEWRQTARQRPSQKTPVLQYAWLPRCVALFSDIFGVELVSDSYLSARGFPLRHARPTY
jgi:hypothetical protein